MTDHGRHPSVPPELYTREYYLADSGGACEGSKEFKETGGTVLSARLAATFEEIVDVDGGSFLDIGCGRGEISLHLEKLASRVVAIDYSEAAVAIARQVLQKTELIHADVVEYLAHSEAEPFDGVILVDVVEHLYDWQLEVVFEHTNRLLKPGGRAYIDTPISPTLISSTMHVNVKQSVDDLRAFLPGYELEKMKVTDPAGLNHLVILRKPV